MSNMAKKNGDIFSGKNILEITFYLKKMVDL